MNQGLACRTCRTRVPGKLRHPGYIASWLKVLGSDTRAIFTAAGKANEAANYMRQTVEPNETLGSNPAKATG